MTGARGAYSQAAVGHVPLALTNDFENRTARLFRSLVDGFWRRRYDPSRSWLRSQKQDLAPTGDGRLLGADCTVASGNASPYASLVGRTAARGGEH